MRPSPRVAKLSQLAASASSMGIWSEKPLGTRVAWDPTGDEASSWNAGSTAMDITCDGTESPVPAPI